jgi:hypothetical protein
MFDKIPEEFDKNVLSNIAQNQAAYSSVYVTGFLVTYGNKKPAFQQAYDITSLIFRDKLCFLALQLSLI